MSDLKEVIRLLMHQVRTEQHARASLVRALVREDSKPVSIPTDEEVEARIQELETIVRGKHG